jgi:hypothetical protein
MLLSVGYCNFLFLVYGTLAVSPGQKNFKFFCLWDIVRCLTVKFMKLECLVDKTELNDVF